MAAHVPRSGHPGQCPEARWDVRSVLQHRVRCREVHCSIRDSLERIDRASKHCDQLVAGATLRRPLRDPVQIETRWVAEISALQGTGRVLYESRAKGPVEPRDVRHCVGLRGVAPGPQTPEEHRRGQAEPVAHLEVGRVRQPLWAEGPQQAEGEVEVVVPVQRLREGDAPVLQEVPRLPAAVVPPCSLLLWRASLHQLEGLGRWGGIGRLIGKHQYLKAGQDV